MQEVLIDIEKLELHFTQIIQTKGPRTVEVDRIKHETFQLG